MISRFFTIDPAPLDVRVARVVATPWPFAAYFLIRAPQVAEGIMVPWPEAVTVTLLAAVLVPLWLYWVADLFSWTRDRRTAEPSALELTADLSGHGTFEGDLAALVDAEAHGRAVPPKAITMARAWGATDEAIRKAFGDDHPTEPLLLTHEFTPASGIAMASNGPASDHTAAMAEFDRHLWRLLPPFIEQEIYVPPRSGRHRRAEQARPIPPIADVPNAEAYAFLNRSRELDY